MKNRHKSVRSAALCVLIGLLASLLLSSCGGTAASENQLSFRSNGTITADYFAAFPKEQYNLTLFEEEARASVKAYNEEAGSRRIRLLSVEENEGTAHVSMRYRSYEDYKAFNNQELYYGTAQDGLADLAFSSGSRVYAPEGSDSAAMRELAEAEKNGEARWRVIVVREPILIRHPGTPAYLSKNAELLEDGSVRVSGASVKDGASDPALIVYKK